MLRVKLEGIEPLIWRRVTVGTGMSLVDVHRAMQAVMGWRDSNLWYFETGDGRYAPQLQSEPDWNGRYEDAGRKTLGVLAGAGVRRMSYVYDMGDFWEHVVVIERITAPIPDTRYPLFLGGERRCPPEDCGGPQGYYEFLKNISSKRRRTREEALGWYGGQYDPDDIGEPEIALALRNLAVSSA